ncbi:MAG: hypothetical protein K2I64_03295 [Muribaculaceae bacterium]|nr:hypothetical protein [Muribaculaceae bacterium]
MRYIISVVIFSYASLCYDISAQIDSLLYSLNIHYSDTLPERFVLDDYGVPCNPDWKPIPLSREIETEYFNPFISRAGYDYSFYEEGDLAPMVILQAFNLRDRKYLMYRTGSFGLSFYLVDISDGNVYPPTLLIHYTEASLPSVLYEYDRHSNVINISCINSWNGLRVDMKYSLDKGFTLLGKTYYKKIVKQVIEDSDFDSDNINPIIWDEISESEWNNLIE